MRLFMVAADGHEDVVGLERSCRARRARINDNSIHVEEHHDCLSLDEQKTVTKVRGSPSWSLRSVEEDVGHAFPYAIRQSVPELLHVLNICVKVGIQKLQRFVKAGDSHCVGRAWNQR